jgi:hypothetical protein
MGVNRTSFPTCDRILWAAGNIFILKWIGIPEVVSLKKSPFAYSISQVQGMWKGYIE